MFRREQSVLLEAIDSRVDVYSSYSRFSLHEMNRSPDTMSEALNHREESIIAAHRTDMKLQGLETRTMMVVTVPAHAAGNRLYAVDCRNSSGTPSQCRSMAIHTP
jgi:hypothetical protein